MTRILRIALLASIAFPSPWRPQPRRRANWDTHQLTEQIGTPISSMEKKDIHRSSKLGHPSVDELSASR